MDFLDGLNPAQREAAAFGEGPLLILAGAGSGKTRVITHRICHLIHSRKASGNNILAVTFTNKASTEMQQRVTEMLGASGCSGVPVLSTFHSFCVRLLRADGASLAELRPGFTPSFLIYDESDQLVNLKAAFQDVNLDEKFMPYPAALSRISHAKNRKESPEDFYKAAKDPAASRLAVVYEHYEAGLRQANALDFDDLLLEAVRLLRHNDKVRQIYNEKFRYLLIDEYQDTNRPQYELLRLLSQAQQNVCVVGDEDQSIYSWRGADIRNILDFKRDYPGAVTIRLEQNYRSTETILEAASSVVANNSQRIGKWLWTEAGQGEPIGLYRAEDAESEALFVASTIEQLLRKEPLGRVAILYRTNAQSRQIEEALRRYGRSYLVVGGLSFYQRSEIKDLLAYLKLLVSPNDPVSLRRIINKPARGIGLTTLDQIVKHSRQRSCSLWKTIGSLLDENLLSKRAHAALEAFRKMIEALRTAAQDEPLGTLLSRIADDTGYREMLASSEAPGSESRLENLHELINAAVDAAARGESISEFLDHAALVSDSDSLDEKSQVSLLTLHNAKGLEWPTVFITGFEEGLFPHGRSLDSDTGMEEERRLCYVGMTRAEKRLFLSWARQRRRFGRGPSDDQSASRFLSEIPMKFIDKLGEQRKTPEVDLYLEQHEVRETAKKSTYTGKTYNSVENIAQFFQERGLAPPPASSPKTKTPAKVVPLKSTGPRRRGGVRPGTIVVHPRYGRGKLLRREGEGDDAKLTVSFPDYGLKKLIAKFAGLKVEE